MMFVFDFDGVLADSSAIWLAILRKVHADMAGTTPIPDDFWDRLNDINVGAMMHHLGVRGDQVGIFVGHMHRLMSEGAYQPALFAGVDAALRGLAQRGPVAILSASPAGEAIEATLQRAGLLETIAAIHDGRDPASKAEKLPVLLREFGVEPAGAVMIGDAISDIRAGRAIGMRTAAVSWGWQSRELLTAAGPDWLLTRVDQLLTLPERLDQALVPRGGQSGAW
jgi:phosphoglycolate phosphatase-like HAD superfamily hydrolase